MSLKGQKQSFDFQELSPLYCGLRFPMTKQVRIVKSLINGVFRGLEAPADTFQVNHYTYPHASERDALRGDWKRVGDQIQRSMNRHGKTTA